MVRYVRSIHLVILSLVLVSPLRAFLPLRIPPRLQAKLERLPRYPVPHPIFRGNKTFHGDRGTLRTWRPRNVSVPPGDPRTMAETFLRQYAADFGLKPDLSDLEYVRSIQIGDGYRVTFRQIVEGTPVQGGYVEVVVRNDGRVIHAMSDYHPDLALFATTPTIPCDSVERIVSSFMEVPLKGVSSCEMQVFPADTPRLAYVITFKPLGIQGRWRGVVDAQTGEILALYNFAASFQSATVFRPDPVTTAGTVYGAAGFTDNQDQDTPELNSQLRTVTLDNPWIAGDSVYLVNPRVQVIRTYSWDPPYDTLGYDTSVTWIPRSSDLFEGVMAFYHLNRLFQRIENVGISMPKVFVHPLSPDSGAWTWIDSAGNFVIELGGAGDESVVDAGEDAAILAHEYFHVVEMKVIPGGFCRDSRCGVEPGAIGEGFADFLGASYALQEHGTYGDTIGKWGLRPYWNGRSLVTFRRYPDDTTDSPHLAGQFLSAPLWSLLQRGEFYVATLDKIVMGSMIVLPRTSTLRDAARAMIQTLKADSTLCPNAGACASFFREFWIRGLLQEPSLSWVSTGIPDTMVAGSEETVHWLLTDIDDVGWRIQIEISLNEGGTWIALTEVDVDEFPGSATITLPYVPVAMPALLKARLYGPGRFVLSVTEPDTFLLVPPPIVQVLTPSEGEEVVGGQSYIVTWTIDDPYSQTSRIRLIFYYGQPGEYDITYIDSVTTQFVWHVPRDRVTDQAQIRVQLLNQRGVLIGEGLSPLFRIVQPPEVQLHWPNGPGIQVVEGKTYWVRYSAYTPEKVDSVTGWLSLDGGNTFPRVIRGQRFDQPQDSVQNDSLQWVIDFPPSKTIRVKVEALSARGRVGTAVSSHNIGYRLARPTAVQVQVTDSGLGLSWQDRSNYETRYMLKARAFSWDGDTLESAKYLTGTNGTSAFVAWNDPFWDFIPAGTALQKIVVGVYAARDTVINGDSVRFFSDVVWAETLRPAPPSLVSVTVVADSGIRS